MTFFGGQVQPVKPILRIQEKTLGAEKVSLKKQQQKKPHPDTSQVYLFISPIYLSND